MAFKTKLKIVDQLTIGSPCPDSSFEKNAKVQQDGWYCNLCSKEVYDLKKLSRKEIAKLIKSKNGNFCAVISRRQDGSLITKEPVSTTNSLVSAGILLASTTLINSSAMAQSERGDIAPPIHAEPNVAVGGISMQPTSEVSSENSSEVNMDSQENKTAQEANPVATPMVHTAGRVVVQKRGKVKIDPK